MRKLFLPRCFVCSACPWRSSWLNNQLSFTSERHGCYVQPPFVNIDPHRYGNLSAAQSYIVQTYQRISQAPISPVEVGSADHTGCPLSGLLNLVALVCCALQDQSRTF